MMPTNTITALSDTQNRIWRVWTGSKTSGSTTACTCPWGTDDSIWNGWVTAANNTTGTITITTNAVQDAVWRVWLNDPHTRIEVVRSPSARVLSPAEAEADRQRREAARIESERQEALRRAARDAASKRARSLLVANLTREQRAQYEKHGYFDVQVDGKTYRINQGTHGNVAQVDDKGPIERYCVQPDGVPTEDAMLAQLLALRHAPHEFFAKANRTRIRN
jgi:hypothetical protein